MNKIGIDVSSYQGEIDWRKVKEAGIEFAILKVIRKDLSPDKQFENNLRGCFEVGMPVQGVYNYSYATTKSKAATDAKRVIEVLADAIARYAGMPLKEYLAEHEIMVHMDVEDDCMEGLGSTLIDIINVYAEVILAAGLKFGLYTGQFFYNTYIKPYGSITHPKWIARYGKNSGTMEEDYKPNMKDIIGWQYTSKGSVDGIKGNVDMDVWYDENPAAATEPIAMVSRQAFVDKAMNFLGVKEGSAAHKEIINIYNAHKPLAKGYAVKYTDSWCATFVSTISILCGVTDIIPTECSCQRQIELFKHLGVWEEDGRKTPEIGDIIYYNWDDNTQENDGWADHVGIVERVSGGVITVIEGNYKDSVKERKISVGAGNIRGYARPKYKNNEAAAKKTITEIAKEVINGIWGNGTKRKANLEAAGYKYSEVQAMVNAILKANSQVYHTVVKGDTVSGIAKRYETSVNAIMEMNNIANKDKIYLGQKIRVK